MPKKARKVDYLIQRPGCNWAVRLQIPGGKAKEVSLRTSDYREAEVRAQDYIKEHKARLLAARMHIEETWQHKLEPGRKHLAPDGGEIIATEKELLYIGQNGAITKTEPNGNFTYALVGGPMTVRSLARAFLEADGEAFGPPAPHKTVATKNGDDALFKTYLDHGGKKNTGVHGYFRREAEAVWALFRRLTNNKPLKDCTREDGRKLVTHFQAEGLKSATIQKKIIWLNSAVNFAIKEGRFQSINPFSGIAPKGEDDEQERLPFNDADARELKRNLGKLREKDQLLFRLLATTGMRLSEAFEVGKAVEFNGDKISGERTEKGVRFCIVGHKTKQSKRRVPFPTAILPHLPKSIKGQLFTGSVPAASKRLNRFLRDCGIADPRKVVHSLRHRAQDRLRAAGCPQDVRWALLGHEEKTVAAGYGEGFPVPLLRKWIDKIGF
jgi:integrase